jgi:hypothetical protein
MNADLNMALLVTGCVVETPKEYQVLPTGNYGHVLSLNLSFNFYMLGVIYVFEFHRLGLLIQCLV